MTNKQRFGKTTKPLKISHHLHNQFSRISQNLLTSRNFSTHKVEKIDVAVDNLVYDVQVDENGDVWTCGYTENLLTKYSFAKGQIETYRCMMSKQPLFMLMYPNRPNCVLVVSNQHNSLTLINLAAGTWQHLLKNLSYPRGMTMSSSGELYICQATSPCKLNKLKLEEVGKTLKVKLERTVTFGNAISGIWSAGVNPRDESEIFLSFYSSQVLHKMIDGECVKTWKQAAQSEAPPVPFGHVNGMCFYEDHILLTDRTNNCIRDIDLKTGLVTTLDVSIPQPNGIAVDKRRNIFYVVAHGGLWIIHFTSPLRKHMFAKYPAVAPCDIVIHTAK